MNTKIFAALTIAISIVSITCAIETDNYIVGGQNARPRQFPSKVSLRTLKNVHFCGAAIIGQQWIVTAAHCVVDRVRNPNSLIAVINPVNRRSGRPFRINRIVIHPRFNPNLRHNDIAMLHTVNRIPFDQDINRARLPVGDNNSESRVTLIVAGLGLTRYPNVNGNGVPQNLQFMRTVTLPLNECRRALQNRAPLISDKSLCAVSKRGRGLCTGDGGSPLYTERFHVLRGIAAWSNACGRGSPDIYTRIVPHLAFIRAVVKGRGMSS